MPQESTLLAYLVPRLTSSVEDTATDALAFILNKSPACRDALGLLLSEADRSSLYAWNGSLSPGHRGMPVVQECGILP